MSFVSSSRATVQGIFFLLISASKTLVNIGQACLTVDATFLALNCLSQYHEKTIDYDNDVSALNIAAQTTAVIFSTLMVALTRYQSIWKHLNLENLQEEFKNTQNAIKDLPRKRRIALFIIGFLGFLSCVARGLSAFLGVEVILSDRVGLHSSGVIVVGWIALLTVMISAMCFNLSNMLASVAKYLKEPSLSFRPSVMVSMIATVSNAVAMRFFILHFLDRQNANEAGQFIGQSVFTVAEFVMGLFTMVSSFDESWKDNAKETLTHAWPLTVIIVGDAITAWLGYSTITWYSILTDLFLNKQIAPDFMTACVSNPSNTDFTTRWVFMGLACFIGVPTTLAYLNYLLEYARESYDKAKNISYCCRYGTFRSEEKNPILPQSSYNAYSVN